MQMVFYALLGLTTLIAGTCFLANTFSSWESRSKNMEKIIMLVALVASGVLLYLAGVAGHVQHEWGLGILFIVLAVVVFLMLFWGGLFAFGRVHWQ